MACTWCGLDAVKAAETVGFDAVRSEVLQETGKTRRLMGTYGARKQRCVMWAESTPSSTSGPLEVTPAPTGCIKGIVLLWLGLWSVRDLARGQTWRNSTCARPPRQFIWALGPERHRTSRLPPT
jgi:hypothetical protein